MGIAFKAFLISVLAAFLSWGVIYNLLFGSSLYLSGQADLFMLHRLIRDLENFFRGAAVVYWIIVNILLILEVFRGNLSPNPEKADSIVFVGFMPLIFCVLAVLLMWFGFLVAGITNSIISNEMISITAGLVSMLLSVVWMYYKEFIVGRKGKGNS